MDKSDWLDVAGKIALGVGGTALAYPLKKSAAPFMDVSLSEFVNGQADDKTNLRFGTKNCIIMETFAIEIAYADQFGRTSGTLKAI